ncbi:hypothetical protein PsorP6_001857 [Peronosclerospora sorghi]|uniref:Uncharacterized protein n=1 Tax=Peronosclerospora sorghi TaxID=230839 RepID=A0ACC0WUJ7_9STRA|nr:hypothetical protein PsorP6_001857 [Peronosclerospora sorghi]
MDPSNVWKHSAIFTMGGGSLFQVGKDVEFWRVLVQLSILAFCLVFVEGALHKLEHKFPPSEKYQHMLKKAYRELMVLGLISLGLKILKEIPTFNSYSKTMLAFQVADLTIFLLALMLIVQCITVFLLLQSQNDRAERAELVTTQDLANLVANPKASQSLVPSFCATLFCCGKSANLKRNKKELIELRLLRRLFLRRFGLPQLFPFSKYINRAQVNQIAFMIEVEPSMWVVLLLVAWSIFGLLELLKKLDTNLPESHELVESFMLFGWLLLLLNTLVFFYFRTCVNHLLQAAAFSTDKATLVANLSAIAEEEAEAWRVEEADKALIAMCCIQEHHEELESLRRRQQVAEPPQVLGENDTSRNSFSGVDPDSPVIKISFFSYKSWHVVVMLLFVLNGFLITLFVQCTLYDLGNIYEDFGTVATIMIPLPLFINAFVLQRHIFYDFVVVSNILRIDSHTLSAVVENFSEVVRLRSEFATTVLQHLNHQELTIADLEAELQAQDRSCTGYITVDDLRDVLSKFGFRLTRFRFNTVVKMLFELKDMTVRYDQVIRLISMAQNENLGETTTTSVQPHPLLRPSVMMYDDFGQSSMRSQSNYSVFHSTRQLPIMDCPSPADFGTVAAGSAFLPQISHRGGNVNGASQIRPSVSARALHGLFNLEHEGKVSR